MSDKKCEVHENQRLSIQKKKKWNMKKRSNEEIKINKFYAANLS